MAGKFDAIFFAREQTREGFVIGHTNFFSREENRMTNRIAFQKSQTIFIRIVCKCVLSLSTHITIKDI